MGIVRLFGWVMYYLRQLVMSCLAACEMMKQRSYLPLLFSSQQIVAVVIFV